MENIREDFQIETENMNEQEGGGGRRRIYQIPSVDNSLTNIMNLPQVVNDVSLIHKGQALEIRKQQKILDAIQEKLKLVEQQEEKHLETISNITREFHLSEQESQKKKQICNQYEKEIEDLMKECTSQTSAIFHVKKTIKEELWEHDKCRKKVLKYKDDVEEMKTESKDEVTFKEMKQHVEALQLKWQEIQQCEFRETILNGTIIQKYQSEYETLEIQKEENKKKIQETKEKVESLKEEIKQIEQSTYILHKRNKAQLIRLKRELKELITHFGHWKERLVHFQQQISFLHQEICKSS